MMTVRGSVLSASVVTPPVSQAQDVVIRDRAPPPRRGLVPLSADPITEGHLDLIRAARAQCAEVVVLIAENDGKRGSYCFTLAERAVLAMRAIAHAGIDRVRVTTTDRLLVDAYLREGCAVIFRGVRNAADRTTDEAQMRLHAAILPGIDDHVVYVPARAERVHVSSTMVKAFVAHDVDVSSYVPAFVKQALEERIRQQWRIAVTGGVASGKSWVASHLAQHIPEHHGVPATHIDLDQLQRELFEEDSAGAQFVRDGLAALFGVRVLAHGGRMVERRVLKETLLLTDGCSPEQRVAAHKLVQPHIERKLREALHGARGVVFLEWAQLAEMQLGQWTNHHAIVVDTPDRAIFAKCRGITDAEQAAIARYQWSTDRKADALEACARSAGCGRVLRYVHRSASTATDLPVLAKELLTWLPTMRSLRSSVP
ncbi:dephospho-CoA kinase [Candidatus Uhrbacteria bacterium]|nr:dephospho-CoA kinase [Candidatus Uhrbacteria bacterium]